MTGRSTCSVAQTRSVTFPHLHLQVFLVGNNGIIRSLYVSYSNNFQLLIPASAGCSISDVHSLGLQLLTCLVPTSPFRWLYSVQPDKSCFAKVEASQLRYDSVSQVSLLNEAGGRIVHTLSSGRTSCVDYEKKQYRPLSTAVKFPMACV